MHVGIRITSYNVCYTKLLRADIVKEKYAECDMIFGTATAGIAHAALVALRDPKLWAG